MQRGYLETVLALPWNKKSEDSEDLENAWKVLEEGHYGLKEVKERIMEFLAVRKLTHKGKSPILCLVGPPGTGKTSIARSVAEAMNKKYVRICLGGVRDEAEIRGHRKTYVGAMPGRITVALKEAGVSNPLMLLDEIDKTSSDYKEIPPQHFWRFWIRSRTVSSMITMWRFPRIFPRYCLLPLQMMFRESRDLFLTVWS